MYLTTNKLLKIKTSKHNPIVRGIDKTSWLATEKECLSLPLKNNYFNIKFSLELTEFWNHPLDVKTP